MTNPKPSKLYAGSAYYPEQWPEERWLEDARLMAAAGLNVTRMGEFAWSTFEPQAGEYHIDWLESAVGVLAQAGIASVLSTPTAAPPAWLVAQYPDLMALEADGRRVQFGNRCHYCVNSAEFHQAARRVIGALAAKFGSNPQVIGWQLDNEYNRHCYCPRCQALFHAYLAERYGTLDELNRRWTTAYWSQTYSAWEQIPVPLGEHNPGLKLEYQHFMTHSYKRFQRLQVDALRPHLRQGVWITHNFMNWFDGFDHYELNEDLDMASWDWYVGTGHCDYQSDGAAHDLVRGYQRKNFWLMETQPGNVNWKPINTVLNRGEARSMAWHAVGHGADAVLYWQWRSPLGGQEQYHGTLLDHTGQPRPFYAEAREVAQDFDRASQVLAGTQPVAQAAMLNCYDSRWSIQWQRHQADFDYKQHFLHYYRPLAGQNISVDILSAQADLAGYQLVIAPALLILTNQRVTNLTAFVENGGHLVLTVRSGMKDAYNALLPMRQPGGLAELAGVEVEEYYALLTPVPVASEGWQGSSQQWAERLKVLDHANTQVLARYGASNGWLDGHPAITRHSYGKGTVTFVGAYLDEASQSSLLREIASSAGVQPVLQTPEGVEACRRVGKAGREVFILINHTRREQHVPLPWRAYEHLRQQDLEGVLLLGAYEAGVVTRAG